MAFKKYRSHKLVDAAQIKEIDCNNIIFTNGDSILFSQEVMDKHNPQVGWYCIIYEGGYTSFSPKEAFELGNTPVEEYSEPVVYRSVENYDELIVNQYYWYRTKGGGIMHNGEESKPGEWRITVVKKEPFKMFGSLWADSEYKGSTALELYEIYGPIPNDSLPADECNNELTEF